MSNLSGVPLTYIGDPGVTSVPTVVSDGTLAVRNDGSALTVVVAGGTVNTTVSFSGSINTDIGNVKIEDADDNYAVVPDASVAKTGDTNALVVQHIDPTGAPLYQSTQVAIMNAQGTLASEVVAVQSMNNFGTLATAVGQTTGNALATLVHNAQGTLASEVTATKVMNNFGTLATAVAQTTGNAILSTIYNAQGTLVGSPQLAAILNNQGTQATSTLQTTGNSLASLSLNAQGTLASEVTAVKAMNNFGTLATAVAQATGNAILSSVYNAQGTTSPALVTIMNGQGTLATSANQITAVVNGSISNDLLRQLVVLSGTLPPAETLLFNAVTGTGASSAINVLWADSLSVQHVISAGTAAVQVRTSLDGVNWNTEAISTASQIVSLSGRTKFVSANYLNGNAVVTTRLVAAASGGGGVTSSGTTNQWGGFSSALSQTIGATYEVSVDGYNGVGLHLIPPTGGQITFEGSFDGINWTTITLREMAGNGYTQKTSITEDYIGSTACLTKLRFRTSVGGSAPGSVGGRMTVPSNTIEGIEHGNAPHNIGYAVVAKNISFSGSAYNTPVWIPAAGKKWVVTDIFFTVNDVTTVVTIADGYVGDMDHLFKGMLKPGGSNSILVPIQFRVPHVSHSSTGSLTFTQTAAGIVDGVIHGYEIDV